MKRTNWRSKAGALGIAIGGAWAGASVLAGASTTTPTTALTTTPATAGSSVAAVQAATTPSTAASANYYPTPVLTSNSHSQSGGS